ncbi:flagellar motor protein MotB [Paeniroseomonas aquatica]|uniref:flagellar motor protein MotB n=1 Tax=Paeniroseomonas aquatica TaxID=373043 RepID=UPI00360EF7E7
MAGKGKNAGVTIVIKREEGGEAGHHGGAWKVAYADFVTAMMAFFLLMWLLNATSEEQRRGLADYFSPSNVLARAASGSGQPFGGRTPNPKAPPSPTRAPSGWSAAPPRSGSTSTRRARPRPRARPTPAARRPRPPPHPPPCPLPRDRGRGPARPARRTEPRRHPRRRAPRRAGPA